MAPQNQGSGAMLYDDDADIVVKGVADRDKMRWEKWDEMELDPKLLKNIREGYSQQGKSKEEVEKYIQPRKVQQFAIPYIAEGYDVKCQSETGTGKTAAFLVPIIDNLLKDGSPLIPNAPYCIILAPTRELVTQICEQAKWLTKGTNLRVLKTYGEIATKKSKDQLQKGCHILCACIGRLNHFVTKAHLFLDHVKYVVIDEADQFFLTGETQGITKFFKFKSLPSVERRQTIFFSATLRVEKIRKRTDTFSNLKKEVTIMSKAKSNERIDYKVEPVPAGKPKLDFLIEYARDIIAKNNWQCPRIMIFANRKKTADQIDKALNNAKWNTVSTHSDYAQDVRDETLKSFREGDVKSRILVSINVCGRGIDVQDMDYVINYDIPETPYIFIQRCGRTGRVKRGTAITFYVEAEDAPRAQFVKKVIRQAGQEVPQCLANVPTGRDLEEVMNGLSLA
jgi:superfamily II DNA/RNA helicase